MKFNREKIVETIISVFAVGVGILLVGTTLTMVYAIIKSLFSL
jgi:hypothetical protein